MRHSIKVIVYVAALFLLPVFEVVIIAPVTTQPWVILFPLVATLAFFLLPYRPWWIITLLGAFWRDVAELSPYGATLIGAAVLGFCLTLFAARLTGRSFWSDCFVVITSVLLSAVASAIVFLVVDYFGWRVFAIPDVYGEVIGLLLIGFLEAIWLYRQGTQNQYIQ